MTVSYSASGSGTVPKMGRALQKSAQKPSYFEWFFASFTLITYQGAFFPVLRTLRQGNMTAAFDQAAESGDPVARYALLTIIIVSLWLTLAHWRRMVPALRAAWPFWVFSILCLSSAAWSDNPELAFRRAISLFGSFLFGAYAFTQFGALRFIRLMAIIGGIAAFCSLVLLVLSPSLANDPSYFVTNAVRGVYSQKNQLSAYSLLNICAALAALFLEKNDDGRVKIALTISTILLFTTLVLSRGISSIVAFAAVLMLMMVYYDKIHWKARFVIGYFILILVMLIGFLLWTDADDMLSLVGKDASLTGRMPLWIESVKAIRMRPLLGYGYITFWDPESVRTRYIWQVIGWPAPGSHDGYLDLMLGVGVIGAGYYVCLCWRAAIMAVKYAKYNVPGIKWFIMYCAAMFIINIDEGTIAWPDAIAIQLAFGYCMVEAFRAKRRAA
jgi:exopolysaccharide production protein ExoQ